MKPTSRFRLVPALFCTITLGVMPMANAANFYWKSAASGTWDTGVSNWAANSGGATAVAWVDSGSNGAFFDQAGTYTVTINAARTADAVNVSAGVITFDGNNTISANSVVISTGASVITGTVDRILKSGTTLLQVNGILNVGTGAGSGRNVTLSGGGEIQGSGNLRLIGNSNFSGNFTGASGITFEGGNTTLSGTSSNSGVFLVRNNSTLRLSSMGALSTASFLRLSNGAVVELAAGDFSRTVSATASGANVQFNGAGDAAGYSGFAAIGGDRNLALAGATWSNSGGPFSPTEFILGTANSTHKITLTTGIDLNGGVRTISTSNGSAAVGAEISGNLTGTGSSGLAKTGTGTLLLSGTNTYAGISTISAGTLIAAKAVSLANFGTAGKVVLSNSAGSTLALRIGGTGEFTSSNIDSVLTNTTWNAGNYLGFDTTNSGGSFTYNSNITQTIGLTKSGAGTMVLGGNLSYSGDTRLDSGSLEISGSTSTLAGNISGSGNLVKSSTGTLILSGSNSYSGITQISGGILVANRTTQLALGTGAVSVSSGANLTIQDHAGGGQLAYANNLTLAGSGVSGSGALNFYNSGNFDMSGAVAISGGTTIRTDPVNQDYTINFTNIISGSGGLAYFAQGSTSGGTPRFTLTGASTYSGNTILTSSGSNTSPFTVTLSGGNDRLPAGTGLIFGGTPLGSPTGTFNKSITLALAGISQEVASVSTANSPATSGGYRIVGASATLSTLVVNNSSVSNFSGVIGGAGTNENNLGLTKTGSASLTLTGSSTYTGPTSVSSGALLVNGSLGNTAITVSSGATLGGTGSIGGATTISSGGIHAPGNSPGVQTFTNDLTYADGSIFAWDLDTGKSGRGVSNGYDGVNVNQVNLKDGGSAGGTVFRVVLAGGQTFADAFWNLDHSWTDIFLNQAGSAALSWTTLFNSFEYQNGSGVISPTGQGYFTFTSGSTLAWTAVPEPSGSLAGLLLACGLLRRRRARRLSGFFG